MRALIVGAEPPLRDELQDHGMAVTVAGTVTEATAALGNQSFSVVVVDLVQPDGSGLELVDALRTSGSTAHVIALGASASEVDRVGAFRRGADDFVAKPFFVRELTERVLAVGRRHDVPRGTCIRLGRCEVDLGARQVTCDGQVAELTTKEFDLLAYLAARPGHVFDREQLLNAVWRSTSEWQQLTTVTEHVRRLRNKIEIDPGAPTILVTVRGAGYRLDVPAAGDPPGTTSEVPIGRARAITDAAASNGGLDRPGDEAARPSGGSAAAVELLAPQRIEATQDRVPLGERMESEAVAGLLRGLLRARSAPVAVDLLQETIRRLGGDVVPVAAAGDDALPIDVSLGEGAPMLVDAEPFTMARMQLERLLPRLVEDTRQAVALLRRAERLEDETAPDREERCSRQQDVAPADQSPRGFSWELATGVGALADARLGFDGWLTHEAVDPGDSADLVVVLSELVANAIAATEGDQHGAISIRSWRTPDSVVLEVENPSRDGMAGIVVPDDHDPLRGSGRGLLIVASYTDSVEVIPPAQANGLIVRCRKDV